MNAKLRFLGGLVVPMVLVVGCGSSSKSKGGSGGADSGPSGTGATGGAGGTGGSSGGSTGGTSGTTDAGKDKCDKTPCEGNSAGPACCATATACGVTVVGFCAPLSVIDQFKGLDAGFGPAETVVPDPKCKSATFAGVTLTGCCDKSDICGVSTANIPKNPLLSVPLQCITPKESARLGGAAAAGADAGPEVPCDYPGSEKTDAGSKADAAK